MPKKESPTQQVTNALLDQKLTTLTETVTIGFKGVHERQDMTNGKVLKAGNDIVANQSAADLKFAELLATFKYNRVIWYMLTVCVSMIIALGSYIMFNQ